MIIILAFLLTIQWITVFLFLMLGEFKTRKGLLDSDGSALLDGTSGRLDVDGDGRGVEGGAEGV